MIDTYKEHFNQSVFKVKHEFENRDEFLLQSFLALPVLQNSDARIELIVVFVPSLKKKIKKNFSTPTLA